VSQVGIEPTTRGLKVPCSTTELLALTPPKFTSKHQQYERGPPIAGFCLVDLMASLTEEKGPEDELRAMARSIGFARLTPV
jgi:hypothetical protein